MVTSGAGICPHLGIEEDRQTCLAYPSHWNLCYRAQPASIVRLGHQRKTCLLPAHIACPVFGREQPAPLPAELHGERMHYKQLSKKKE
jgi:hypothetical protein